jgi:hypothetical protein
MRDPRKDWYEAFAEAAFELYGEGWSDKMTVEDDLFCETIADALAIRPECERREHP